MAVAKLLQREDSSEARVQDVCLEIWIEGEAEPLLVVGGRWDRMENRYADEASSAVQVMLHRGQADAMRWFVEWIEKHMAVRRLRSEEGLTAEQAVREVWEDEEPVISTLLYGGRRGGKSFIACVFVGIVAVAIPGARIVCVSPEQDHTNEIREVLEEVLLAREWRDFKEATHTFRLVNGSVIELHTGNKRNMKIGKIDFALTNEGQETNSLISQDISGNLIDVAGLQIVTANPPRSTLGAWVKTWHKGITDGHRPESRQFFLNPQRNPHVSQLVLSQQRRGLGELRYRREVLGDMSTPYVDVVFDAYSDSVNLLPFLPVGWRDVTYRVTAKWFGGGVKQIVGTDFDKRAGCSWSSMRFYLRHDDAALEDAVLVIERCDVGIKDEKVMARRLHEVVDKFDFPMFRPDDTIIVGDASGEWQSTKRDHTNPKKITSFEHLEQEGWNVIKPDEDKAGNPKAMDRFDLANGLLRQTEDAEPVIYVLRDALEVVESLRAYPSKNGRPARTSEHAHPADTWTYVAWRRWGAYYMPDEDREMVAGYHGVPRRQRSEMFGSM
jgi:hypothetical protein